MIKETIIDTLMQTGYRVLEDAIDSKLLERINKKSDLLVPHRAHGMDHKYYPRSKLSECTELGMWWSQQVSAWPEVVSIADTLINAFGQVFHKPCVYVADVITNEPGNTFVKPHIDSPYRFDKWWGNAELLGIQCIVPLCEFTSRNGGTGLLPGSHTRPWVVKDSYAGVYNAEFLAGVVQPEMRLGDVLAYHPRTLHSTMPNHTDLPRRALLIHVTSEHMVHQLRLVDNIWLE